MASLPLAGLQWPITSGLSALLVARLLCDCLVNSHYPVPRIRHHILVLSKIHESHAGLFTTCSILEKEERMPPALMLLQHRHHSCVVQLSPLLLVRNRRCIRPHSAAQQKTSPMQCGSMVRLKLGHFRMQKAEVSS